MSWSNNYTPPIVQPKHHIYTDAHYDINCAIPLNFAALENSRIKLTPFIPQIHSVHFLEQIQKHPETFHYLPFSIPTSLDELDEFISKLFNANPGHVFLAIHDKTRPSAAFANEGGSFAGALGLINTSIPDLCTEIGGVFIFPDFQRTHVLTNAAGLLIQFLLNLPSDAEVPGLGYRRVQWFAHWENARSIRAAERLGFHKEGTIRWHRALPEGGAGLTAREGDPTGRPGRHSALLSICWDDWVSGVREKLQVQMERN